MINKEILKEENQILIHHINILNRRKENNRLANIDFFTSDRVCISKLSYLDLNR